MTILVAHARFAFEERRLALAVTIDLMQRVGEIVRMHGAIPCVAGSTRSFFGRITEHRAPVTIELYRVTYQIPVPEADTGAIDGSRMTLAQLRQHGFSLLASGDIAADRGVADHMTGAIGGGDDGDVEPEVRAIFGPIANLTAPGLASGDVPVHLHEVLAGMKPGVEHVVIAAEQFLARVAADLAE